MRTLRIHAVKAMSLLLVMAGMATATTANAQHRDGYDRNAQLITGLAIGAVAGYALLEAHDRHKKYKHKHKHHHSDRHHHRHDGHKRNHRHDHRDYRHGYRDHHRDRHRYGNHHRHDRYCRHGGNKYSHERHDKHRRGHGHRDHGVYKIREDYRGHRGDHHKRVTVTHF